jgi:hypothetical protein
MKRRVLLAGIAAAGLVATLSGCTLANAITPPIESELYPTTTEARSSAATIPVPSWVPEGSTTIRLKENTETGATIMTFYAPEGTAGLGAACDATELEKQPQLDDTWWKSPENGEGITCQDGWNIFQYTSQFWAWKTP